MVDLGRLDEMIKRPECDFCSLVVLGCKQTWQGNETWEEALASTDTKCFISALEVDRQQAGGYALQVTEFHEKKPFQWVEFEVVFDGSGKIHEPVGRRVEDCPEVDFGVLRSMFRDCEDNHRSHIDPIPQTRIDPIRVIDVKDMRVVEFAPGSECRYCALSYVVSCQDPDHAS